MSELSVVIPVFNEAASLPDTVAELLEYLPRVADHFELILVNDASTDQSWNIIESFAASHSNIRGIALPHNAGANLATLIGLRAARYPLTLTIDADGQHSPTHIPDLMQAITRGSDVAYAYSLRRGDGIVSDFATLLLKTLYSFLGFVPAACKTSNFRLLRTSLRDEFAHVRAPFLMLDILLRRATDQFAYLPAARRPRRGGTSSHSWSTTLMTMTNASTSHSLKPIHLMGRLGIYMIFGGLFTLYTTKDHLWWHIAIYVILTGVLLKAIAVVGEYAARHYLLALYGPGDEAIAQTPEQSPT